MRRELARQLAASRSLGIGREVGDQSIADNLFCRQITRPGRIDFELSFQTSRQFAGAFGKSGL